jgi:hypothetical protein
VTLFFPNISIFSRFETPNQNKPIGRSQWKNARGDKAYLQVQMCSGTLELNTLLV